MMRFAAVLTFTLAACTLGGCKEPGSTGSVPSQASQQDAKYRYTELDPKGDLGSQLEAAAQRAREAGLKPVLYMHASWCDPCKAIAKSMNEPLMKEAFSGVLILGIDTDAANQDALKRHHFKGAIPAWIAIDKLGKPTSKYIDGGAWGENIPKNMAPPLSRYFKSLEAI